ncbi:ABC transporter ATP-binding protein [Qaidamihabitans albus]|uniref:ABC transporter ATP-binding protein n=1 Tax=Qaidamihabitans albus TaxID=2795733 RepID=UPI0018F26768|nr:ATP-binding cassette domain-containing protein [Qaidamihabitans albus]
MPEPVLTVTGVCKSYAAVPALRTVSLALAPGELVVLTGPSGSGKSTLLMIIGGWEAPDEGGVRPHPPLPDRPMHAMPWQDLAFVPQSISLLDELSIAENLAFAGRLRADGTPADVAGLFDVLDLGPLADRLPGEVSRGEQQRAAVGRALAARATLVLADEPTSHQDRRRGAGVLRALRAAADRGAAVLAASHDPVVRDYADREIALDLPGG